METFSTLLALCAGNSPVSGEFPAQRPVTRSFDIFFDLRLNKRLSKQWQGWWFYSERPRGAGFRSVNPAERWRENPARALARAGFSQHLECGIHRSESSPEGSFALIPRPVARWAKLRHNNPFYASTDDVLSIGSAQKRCLQMGRVCDVMEILQSRLATATSRPPARDIRDTVNPPRGFDQSAMLTSYRVWD